MTRNLSIKFFAGISLCLLMLAGQIFAQSSVTGGISGKVTDPRGAIVPNASVTATNIGTNSAVTVTANGDGVYRLSNLQPGTYRVEVNAGNFAPAKAEKIIVEVGVVTPLDVALGVTGATAQVEVTAEAPVINTNVVAHSEPPRDCRRPFSRLLKNSSNLE